MAGGAFSPDELEAFIESLADGHTNLHPRLGGIVHDVACEAQRVKLHAHYLKFRDNQPTVGEFIDAISLKLASFCLPRRSIQRAQESWATMKPGEQLESATKLHQQALDLFKRANKKTNRNGEFGELITYILIELVLKAPQFLAKMSLKTSSQMPIHGSDGIHVSFDSKTGNLILYWGESKCYSSIKTALKNAVKSVAENLEHKKMGHELFLIEQHFDLSAFPEKYRDAILSFIDPYDENYNLRSDVSVVFIAFDYQGFSKLKGLKPADIEPVFIDELKMSLKQYASELDEALKEHGVEDHSVEIFFLPVPSIDQMRKLFQDKIGWSHA